MIYAEAYYYLSSVVAQVFAILIVLTAVFYIYRKRTLKRRGRDQSSSGGCVRITTEDTEQETRG